MATTHIYNKLQDTSIYINLSSQNLHSAFAALKQEAKPLTTLNIKGLGDTKRGSGKRGGGRGAGRARGRKRKWAKTGRLFGRGGNEVYKCFKCQFALVLRG